jgi:hypothetical protein
MTTRGDSGSAFAQFVADSPEGSSPKQPTDPMKIQSGPLLRPVVPPADPKSSQAEKLLDWLVNHWREPTICVRSICVYGPNSIRNRKRAASQAKILAANGWLEPLKAHRRDRKVWRIARGPGG